MFGPRIQTIAWLVYEQVQSLSTTSVLFRISANGRRRQILLPVDSPYSCREVSTLLLRMVNAIRWLAQSSTRSVDHLENPAVPPIQHAAQRTVATLQWRSRVERVCTRPRLRSLARTHFRCPCDCQSPGVLQCRTGRTQALPTTQNVARLLLRSHSSTSSRQHDLRVRINPFFTFLCMELKDERRFNSEDEITCSSGRNQSLMDILPASSFVYPEEVWRIPDLLMIPFLVCYVIIEPASRKLRLQSSSLSVPFVYFLPPASEHLLPSCLLKVAPAVVLLCLPDFRLAFPTVSHSFHFTTPCPAQQFPKNQLCLVVYSSTSLKLITPSLQPCCKAPLPIADNLRAPKLKSLEEV